MKDRKENRPLANQVNEHHSEIDPNEIWMAIEPEVELINAEKHRKKRRGFFWLFFGGLLISTIGIAYFWSNQKTDTTTVTSPSVAQEATNLTDVPTATIPSTANTKTTSDPVETTTPNSSLKQTEENTSAITSSAHATTDDETKATITQNESKSQVQKEIEKPKISTTHQTNAKSNNLIEKQVSNFENAPLPNLQQINPTKQQELVPATEIINNETSPVQSTTVISSENLDIKPEINRLDFILNLPSLPAEILDQRVGFPVRPLPLKIDLEEKADDNTPNYGNPRNFFFGFELNGGISLIGKSLANMPETGDTTTLAFREETESTLEAFHLGAKLLIRHRSGFEFSTGLQMTSINELFRLQTNKVDEEFIRGIKERRIDLNGDTIDVMGDVLLTRTTTINSTVYNSYQLIEIPLLVTYYKAFGNIHAGIQAGVFANLALTTKGQILDENSDFLDIKTEQENLFQSNVGLSYYFGLSLQGPLLSPGLEWSVAPFVRHYPKSFTLDSNALSQKYTLFGLNLGIRYWFGQ